MVYDARMTSQPHLVRQIGLWSGVAVVVGSTIGSGIFKSPAGIAGKVPDPLWMLMVWVLGGVFVLCGALTLAEVGGAYPYSGGIYVYVREAFGRITGFLFGWAQLTLLRPSSVGALALAFGQYATRLTGRNPGSPGFDQIAAGLAVAAIIGVTIANVLGVKSGTAIQNITTVGKSLGLLVLIVLAVVIGLPHAGTHFASSGHTLSVPSFGLALVTVLWAYDGWADAGYVSGEMKDPRRNVPCSILLGTIFVIGIYLLANLGYLAVFSVDQMASSKVIAADAMSKLVGAGGVVFIIATVMVSTFGTLNGTVLTSPRVFFALAEDKLFFPQLAAVHPRFKTPHVSVILVGALGVLYVVVATAFSGDKAFDALTDAFVISMLPFYALGVASVFVFRARRRKGLAPVLTSDSLVDPVEKGHLETHPHVYDPPVRTPLYPLTPIVFIASTVYILVNSLLDTESRTPTLITLGVLVLGVPLYYLTVARRNA
jgi:amino acid transporter